MIAFGCATNDEGQFRAYAAPSIERVAEPGSLLMRRHGYGSIHEPYNEMLDQAAQREDLEAVVLLHQDLSIDDDGFLAKVRGMLAASPDVAIIGAAGARGVRGLAWWEGAESHGYFESPALVPGGNGMMYSRGVHEVDSVDGMLLVLSAWAARELRFDVDLAGPLDGYDMDICLQARAQGRKVGAGGLQVSHYCTYDRFFDRRRWVRAAVALQRKWGGDLEMR
jgi:Glycosyltransferase like family